MRPRSPSIGAGWNELTPFASILQSGAAAPVVLSWLNSGGGGDVLHSLSVAADLVGRIVARGMQAKACGKEARADDNAKTFIMRLHAYEELTARLVDYYRSKAVLKSVDGMQSMDAVTAAIYRTIGA